MSENYVHFNQGINYLQTYRKLTDIVWIVLNKAKCSGGDLQEASVQQSPLGLGSLTGFVVIDILAIKGMDPFFPSDFASQLSCIAEKCHWEL